MVDTKKQHIKESKARKAMPIFEIYAQFINFKASFLDLIAPVTGILEQNPTFSRIQQCEDLLQRVSAALLKNESVSGAQMLVFLYSVVDRGVGMSLKTKINSEKAQRDYGAKADSEFIRKSAEQMKEESHGIMMKWEKTT